MATRDWAIVKIIVSWNWTNVVSKESSLVIKKSYVKCKYNYNYKI